MLVGYARISTVDQVAGFEAQIRDLKKLGCEKIFNEQVSAIAQRDQLEHALDCLSEDDTLVVTKLDRLARSTQHLLQILDRLEVKKVPLRILDFGGSEVDTKSASGKFFLTMFSGLGQFEREMMHERQMEGIARAKAEGKYKGRDPVPKAKLKQAAELKAEGVSVQNIAEKLSLGRSTVYRILKEAG